MSDTSESHREGHAIKPEPEQEQEQNGTGDEERRTRKLFIGGVAFVTTDEEFFKYFAKFGELEDCVLIREKETGQSRGFGFVTYKDRHVAEHVVEQQLFLDGRRLDPKPSISRCSMNQIHEHKNQASKIFVGGLHDEAVEAELTEHFGQFGEVLEVNIMYDRFTNAPRGFGFVTFKDVGTAHKVIDYEGQHMIHGKAVDCKSATARKDALKRDVEHLKPSSREERWSKYHGDEEEEYAAHDTRSGRYPAPPHQQHPYHHDHAYAAHSSSSYPYSYPYARDAPPPSGSYPAPAPAHYPYSYAPPPPYPYSYPPSSAAAAPPAYDYARYDAYYQHRAQPPPPAALSASKTDDAKSTTEEEEDGGTKTAAEAPSAAANDTGAAAYPASSSAAAPYAYPSSYHAYPPPPYPYYGYPAGVQPPSAPYDYYRPNTATNASPSAAVAPPRLPPSNKASSSSQSHSGGYRPARGSSAVNSAQRSRYSAY